MSATVCALLKKQLLVIYSVNGSFLPEWFFDYVICFLGEINHYFVGETDVFFSLCVVYYLYANERTKWKLLATLAMTPVKEGTFSQLHVFSHAILCQPYKVHFNDVL